MFVKYQNQIYQVVKVITSKATGIVYYKIKYRGIDKLIRADECEKVFN